MKIVADSGCDFTTEMKNNSNIVQVPLTLQINDEIFSDTLDLDIVNFRIRKTEKLLLLLHSFMLTLTEEMKMYLLLLFLAI